MKRHILNNSSTAPISLTPEQVVEQARAIRSQIPEATALTAKQRKALRREAVAGEPIVQASINMIGVSGIVSAALGQPIEGARVMQDEAIRWKAAEEEVRALLSGIIGANLIRRQKLATLGARAYAIGSQMARVPENEVLVSHVEEIRRLKKLARRPKRRAPQE